MTINVENDAMLGRNNDSIYATKFYVMQKQIDDLQQENKQLKDNWNKLKEYCEETKLKEFEKSYGKRYGKTFTQAEIIVCNMILDKMQEIEQVREVIGNIYEKEVSE